MDKDNKSLGELKLNPIPEYYISKRGEIYESTLKEDGTREIKFLGKDNREE